MLPHARFAAGVVLTLLAVTAAAWTPSGGPVGGTVLAVAFDPGVSNTVYLGTEGGAVFKSTNGGTSWQPARSGITFPTVQALAAASGTVWAGTPGRGVYKSADGGATWLPSGLVNKEVISLSVDPAQPSRVFAGTAGDGVYRSDDGGTFWSPPSSGLTSGYVFGVAAAAGALFAASNSGLYRSTDALVWTPVARFAGYSVEAVAGVPGSPRMYAGAGYGACTTCVFTSPDGGATWEELGGGLPADVVHAVLIDPTSSERLFVRTEASGVWRSEDAGATWTRVATGLTNGNLRSLAVGGGVALAGTAGGGVFRFSGSSWSAVNTGLAATVVNALASPVHGTVYAGSNAGFARSADGGATWTESNTGLVDAAGNTPAVNALQVMPGAAATVWAATAAGVFRSVDGGGTWSPISDGPLLQGELVLPVEALAWDPQTSRLWAATHWGIMSCGGSGGWINTGECPASPYAEAVVTVPASPPNPWGVLVGTQGGVCRSTDAGGTWEVRNTGLPSSSVSRLASSPAFAQRVYVVASAGIARTVNLAETWDAVSSLLYSTAAIAVAPSAADHLLLSSGAGGGGVFRSTDGGTSFATANTGLEGMLSRGNIPASFAFSPTNEGIAYLGSDGEGVWTTSFTAGGDVNGDGAVTPADVFSLVGGLLGSGGETGGGDANGDGVVSVADVFFLINYLFAGGPAPG